jgi:hypothetical protein
VRRKPGYFCAPIMVDASNMARWGWGCSHLSDKECQRSSDHSSTVRRPRRSVRTGAPFCAHRALRRAHCASRLLCLDEHDLSWWQLFRIRRRRARISNPAGMPYNGEAERYRASDVILGDRGGSLSLRTGPVRAQARGRTYHAARTQLLIPQEKEARFGPRGDD